MKSKFLHFVFYRLSDIMGGKGFGKGQKYQAKVAKLKLQEVNDVLIEMFK